VVVVVMAEFVLGVLVNVAQGRELIIAGLRRLRRKAARADLEAIAEESATPHQ
jgi:hypothetical protein